MSTFMAYEPDQPYLLPPDMRDWLPEGDLALFVSDMVDQLDLSAIYRTYEGDGRGRPAYHPAMMVKLLIYGYCTGKTSSRKLEEATWRDIAVRVLAANQHPDHDTIAAFRKRHLAELRELFLQGTQDVPGGRPGEAGYGGIGRDEDQGQRLQAPGHELRSDGRDSGSVEAGGG